MASAPGQAAHEANCGCEEKMRWLTKANQVVMYNLLLCVDVSHLHLPFMFIIFCVHALFILCLL